MYTFTLDPVLIIQFVVAVLLPVLVGLVTQRSTRPGVKATLLALFSFVASILTGLVDAIVAEVPFDFGTAFVLGLPTFVIAVSTHYGLWKPTGVSATVQDVGGPKHAARDTL